MWRWMKQVTSLLMEWMMSEYNIIAQADALYEQLEIGKLGGRLKLAGQRILIRAAINQAFLAGVSSARQRLTEQEGGDE